MGILESAGAAISLVHGLILPNFEPIREFMLVLTTCKNKQVAQWATIAHLGASIMFGKTIIYDAQWQVTLNLKH